MNVLVRYNLRVILLQVSMGRSPDCDIHLNEMVAGQSSISRRHAVLQKTHNGSWTVTDQKVHITTCMIMWKALGLGGTL